MSGSLKSKSYPSPPFTFRSPLERYLYIVAGADLTHRSLNVRDPQPDAGPGGGKQDKDGQRAATQILLEREALIRRNHQFVTVPFSRVE